MLVQPPNPHYIPIENQVRLKRRNHHISVTYSTSRGKTSTAPNRSYIFAIHDPLFCNHHSFPVRQSHTRSNVEQRRRPKQRAQSSPRSASALSRTLHMAIGMAWRRQPLLNARDSRQPTTHSNALSSVACHHRRRRAWCSASRKFTNENNPFLRVCGGVRRVASRRLAL